MIQFIIPFMGADDDDDEKRNTDIFICLFCHLQSGLLMKLDEVWTLNGGHRPG